MPLKDQLSGFDAGEALLSVLSDPDVQMVIQAKQEKRGIEVRLKSEDGTPPPEPKPSDPPKALTPEEANIRLVMDAIDKKFEPIREDVKRLKDLADVIQSNAATAEIRKVADGKDDFDKYRKAMGAAAKDNPGLTVEELYILAKHRAGDLKPAEAPSTFSERPTPTPRHRESGDKTAEARHGRKGWNDAIASALDNIKLE